MPSASLFCVVMLANFLLFIKCKPIENQNTQSNAGSAPGGLDVFANDGSKFENMVERLSSKMNNNNTCTGICNEKNSNTLSELKQRCPYESKELCLIYSLSKIAKVQVATFSETSRNRKLKSNTFSDLLKDIKDLKNYQKFKEENLQDNFRKRNEGNHHFGNVSREQMNSTNIHCRAIQDLYIPEAGQKLPAFACQLKNNTFILSSERFLQDRRLHLDIKVDENSFKNIRLSPKMSSSNAYNAIPALLILNTANNGYTVEMHQNLSQESYLGQEAIDR